MKKRILSLCLMGGVLLLNGCADEAATDTGSNTKTSPENVQFYGVVSQVSGDIITVSNGNQTRQYNIANATKTSDSSGNSATFDVGMMVTVDTTPNAAATPNTPSMANAITYDSDVEGIIESNNILPDNSGQMEVMGQIVTVDDMTMYNTGISHASDLVVGTTIEVSGIVNHDTGSILAKHIKLKLDNQFEVKGIVTIPEGSVDVTAFMIGNCEININDTTLYVDLVGPADIVNGIEVEVKATVDMATIDPTAPCPITADKIILLAGVESIVPPMPADGTGTTIGGTTPNEPVTGTPPTEQNPPVTVPPETPPTTSEPMPVEIHGMAVQPAVGNVLEISSTAPDGSVTTHFVNIVETTIFEGGVLSDIIADTKLTVIAFKNIDNGYDAKVVIIRRMEVPIMDMAKVTGVTVAAPIENIFDLTDTDSGNILVVTIIPTTMIKGGGIGDIVADTNLVIKGYLNVDLGTLEAHVIEINPVPMTEKVSMGGALEAVDATAGTVTVMGQNFIVTTETVISGFLTAPAMPPVTDTPPPALASNPDVPAMEVTPPEITVPLTLADLEAAVSSGLSVHIVSYRDAAGGLVAIHIQVMPAMPAGMGMSGIMGVISIIASSTATTYSVEGVSVAVSSTTEMSPDIADGDKVRVRGEYDGVASVLTATVIELL